MLKATVGVMPLWDEEKDSFWMLPGYFEGIEKAGGIPIMLPLSNDEDDLERLLNLCDGFLFTGGHDVSPKLYNEEPLDCVCSFPKRDEMESIVLKKAIEKNKPVLGICAPYDVPVHSVDIIKDTPLYKCLGIEKLSVNSYHHQAVKRISSKLEIMAISEDGLVEALYMPNHKFLWAVQWHPEFSYKSDNNSQKIFDAFVEAMKIV